MAVGPSLGKPGGANLSAALASPTAHSRTSVAVVSWSRASFELHRNAPVTEQLEGSEFRETRKTCSFLKKRQRYTS
jgi:hypothetical protein